MDLQAVTGQLYIVNGMVRGTTAVPGILAQPAPSRTARGRERDFLFVHLTLTGQAEETAVLAQDLLDSISRYFFQTSGSVTAALRQAITHANQQLLRLNLSGSGTPLREGALTCAALHHGELFTVQVGESIAMVGHTYGIERLSSKPAERNTPLGQSRGLDMRFTHQRLQDGATLLLADPRMAPFSTNAFEDILVDTQVEDGLDKLTDLLSNESARLLLVEFADEKTAINIPDAIHTPIESGEPLAVIPQPRREPRQSESTPTSNEERRPQRPMRKRPLSKSEPIRSISPASLNLDIENKARHATAQAAMGLSRFTAWLVTVLERLRTTRENEEPIGNLILPALIAIIVPLIIGGVVTGVYLQRGRVQQLTQVKSEMALNLGLGDQAADADQEESARELYNQVLTLAEMAEADLRPGDIEVARLRSEARARLDALNEVVRLTGNVLYEYEEEVELTAVVLTEGSLFTLDSANGVVYEHPIDGEFNLTSSTPLLHPVNSGQVIGTHVIGQIIDMMWRPEGSAVSREGLALLDSNGALLTLHAPYVDTQTAVLGLSSEWQQPTAMTTYNERLYILDNGTAQIWKYYPSNDQFDVKPDERTIGLTDPLNLEQAADIGIYAVDGSLVVVYETGQIRYYDTRANRRQWDETILQGQENFRTPLGRLTAVKLVGPGIVMSIYVADAGNGRLLRLTRDGNFQDQFQATGPNNEEMLLNITDFAIAENPLRIFAVSGNQLLLAEEE